VPRSSDGVRRARLDEPVRGGLMSQQTTTQTPLPESPSAAPDTSRSVWTARGIALGLLPLILLAVVIALIVATDGGFGDRTTPPIEELSVQRVTLPEPGLIEVDVTNDGPDPITIAQVMVDDAYWQFDIDGDGTLGRLESTTISIPYPWVQDEAHAIAIVSS